MSDSSVTTTSGIPVKAAYGPGDVPEGWDPGKPGVAPFTRGTLPGGYRDEALDDAPVRGLLEREASRTGATASSSSAGRRGLSVAFDLPTQIGYDSDHTLARGEVGKVGVADRRPSRTWRRSSTGFRWTRVSISMTINATASILLALLLAVARGRGIAVGEALRHDPERHPQGVRGARDVHLPARALDAPRDGRLRVLRRARSRAGTRSRSPATTSARPARRRCRRSPSRSPTDWNT